MTKKRTTSRSRATTKKASMPSKRSVKSIVVYVLKSLWQTPKHVWTRWLARIRNFLSRRPHRSFRRTYRRDITKLTPLPSNIFFTSDVFALIRREMRPYMIFVVLYTVVFTLLVGIINQENYSTFSDSIKELGSSVVGGDFGKAGETALLFTSVISGQLNDSLGESQQVYVGILSLMTWMAVVWFLRHRLGGASVKVRDAVYNSGAPIVPTLVIALVGLFQLVPGALGVIAYFAATATGVVRGGVESMVFAVAAILLVVLSLYWITSTVFGLVIVTIPGTYPFRALSLAGDVVVGRRSSLLLRLLWMVFIVVLLWAFVLIPAILLADALPWKWLPIVPLTAQLLAGASIVFAASYVYLLYRRMIDAAPISRSRKKV